MNREDLKNYRYNQKWIQGRMDYIEELNTNITKVTSTLSDMPRGSKPTQDSMAENIAKLLDSVNDLTNNIVKQNEKQKEILSQLDKVEQPYRLILESVYIQGKTLVMIANEMSYSYVDVCRKHGIALNKFDKIQS